MFALTYGVDPRFPYACGGDPDRASAGELGVFVDRVLASTGAAKVDLVGHSEGTFMPQWWLKFLGGAAKTDDYVAMTPLYDGTTLAGLDTLRAPLALFGLSQPVLDGVSAVCASCPQFLRGCGHRGEAQRRGQGRARRRLHDHPHALRRAGAAVHQRAAAGAGHEPHPPAGVRQRRVRARWPRPPIRCPRG